MTLTWGDGAWTAEVVPFGVRAAHKDSLKAYNRAIAQVLRQIAAQCEGGQLKHHPDTVVPLLPKLAKRPLTRNTAT